MANNLKAYFPMIQNQEEVLQRIYKDEEMRMVFEEWNPDVQKDFLDMCTGNKGMRILYDQFFKQIFDQPHKKSLHQYYLLILLLPYR